MKLDKIYGSGKVVRYHTDPWFVKIGQTVSDHTWGMLAIIYKFNPDPSKELLKAVTFHDCGEYLCGDVPYPFKLRSPKIAAEHAKVEEEVLKDLCGFEVILSNEDKVWLKFADRLEAQCFMFTYMPELFGRKDWQENYKACLGAATELGFADDLVDFVDSMTKSREGKWE